LLLLGAEHKYLPEGINIPNWLSYIFGTMLKSIRESAEELDILQERLDNPLKESLVAKINLHKEIKQDAEFAKIFRSKVMKDCLSMIHVTYLDRLKSEVESKKLSLSLSKLKSVFREKISTLFNDPVELEYELTRPQIMECEKALAIASEDILREIKAARLVLLYITLTF
jgi:hypothetical protein